MSSTFCTVGERFSREVTLTPDTVSAFARAAGDDNPVHHDSAFAATTRFRRVIASGTHTSALLLGATATHFSQRCVMVGLEFWTRFRRVVYADETIRVEWLVVKCAPDERTGGTFVDLRGRITKQDGTTGVGAKGRVLLLDPPTSAAASGS